MEIVVKVTGIVERLDIFLFKGKMVFFVHLSFKSIRLTEKNRPSRTVNLAPNRAMTLVCEIYNMEPTPDSVWSFMPGKQVSFEGVLGSERKRHIMIVSSIIADDGSSG